MKNFKTCMFALACTLLTLNMKAQSRVNVGSLSKQNRFRIGAGATFVTMRDFLYSPLMYKSVRTNVQLGYSSKWKKGIFSTDLNIFVGSLTPSSGSAVQVYVKDTDIDGSEKTELKMLELTQIGFNFETGYLHRLSKMQTARTALYLGGSLEESLTYTPGFINLGVMNNASLNARARMDYFLRNGKPVTFGITVPVVSLVTRLPYNQAPGMPDKSDLATFFTGNNHIESFNHFQKACVFLKYNWLVRKHVACDVTYEASWIHYYKPAQLTQAGSQLTIGLTL